MIASMLSSPVRHLTICVALQQACQLAHQDVFLPLHVWPHMWMQSLPAIGSQEWHGLGPFNSRDCMPVQVLMTPERLPCRMRHEVRAVASACVSPSVQRYRPKICTEYCNITCKALLLPSHCCWLAVLTCWDSCGHLGNAPTSLWAHHPCSARPPAHGAGHVIVLIGMPRLLHAAHSGACKGGPHAAPVRAVSRSTLPFDWRSTRILLYVGRRPACCLDAPS